MENNFRVNAYFNNDGENIERLIVFYLENLLKDKEF